jgi:hypothetical protein
MLACEFISYTQGAHLGAINFASNVPHFDVDELPPPAGKEYLEGSVYFGVVDNHLVALQSSALRTKDLERHLNWFLRNKAGASAKISKRRGRLRQKLFGMGCREMVERPGYDRVAKERTPGGSPPWAPTP